MLLLRWVGDGRLELPTGCRQKHLLELTLQILDLLLGTLVRIDL